MKKWGFIGGAIILIGAVGYGGYRFYQTRQILTKTQQELAQTKQTFESTVASLQESLSLTTEEKQQLDDALHATQTNLVDLEQKTNDLDTKVTTYQKLATLDPELLQKYSKVYFLNEHYTPSSLSTIDARYLSDKNRTLQIHTSVLPYLTKMINAAHEENAELRIASAYRSFGTQASLKASYKVTYGAGTANQFSADQGYSEHQLGTTVDLATAKSGELSTTFEKTPEFAWLTAHAHEYGFILSYPKNNKYYIYEPWHWRFVGIDLATKLHTDNKHLYDLDQREIDGYLISIFD